MRYKIRNWSKYQHYKDRNPPWIKLHFELLASEDWVALSDASRVLAIASMLIASRNDGYVPSDPKYLKRVAYLNSIPDFTELLGCGFLLLDDDASKTLADASVSVSVSVSEGGVGETKRGIGEKPTTIEQMAADLASEFVIQYRGKKPFVEDVRVDLQEKLRVYGKHHFDFIMQKIKGERDKSFPLFKFWLSLKIEEQQVVKPFTYTKSKEQLKFEADLELIKQQEASKK